MEYGEGWYETSKGLKRIRSIGDDEVLVEDASERERYHKKGARRTWCIRSMRSLVEKYSSGTKRTHKEWVGKVRYIQGQKVGRKSTQGKLVSWVEWPIIWDESRLNLGRLSHNRFELKLCTTGTLGNQSYKRFFHLRYFTEVEKVSGQTILCIVFRLATLGIVNQVNFSVYYGMFVFMLSLIFNVCMSLAREQDYIFASTLFTTLL